MNVWLAVKITDQNIIMSIWERLCPLLAGTYFCKLLFNSSAPTFSKTLISSQCHLFSFLHASNEMRWWWINTISCRSLWKYLCFTWINLDRYCKVHKIIVRKYNFLCIFASVQDESIFILNMYSIILLLQKHRLLCFFACFLIST